MARSVSAAITAQQHPLWLSVALSVFPGVALGVFIVAATPVLEELGVDPIFALFGGIGVVIVPLELGWLAVVARRTAGTWSPLAVVNYKTRLPARRLLPLALGLAAWFILTLIIWTATLEGSVIEGLPSWVPGAILQFARVSAEGGAPSARVIAALLAVAFVFNGVAGPVTEELYFRGYLLPRIDRHGRWAPVLNSVLFAIYHVWMPWRWPQIVIGFIPLAAAVQRTRSIYVSIIAHVTINVGFLIMLMSSLLAA
ncbi:MAG: CPBP family intramembrane metalloprotease [Candidatus Eisenbacteria bacterium]|nr:CPBP family intramembrane metalloprotease [Candidatus Eisenbacteria bacterium]